MFAPCTASGTDPKFKLGIECAPSGTTGQSGIGVAFGDTVLAAGGAGSGWTNDYTLNASMDSMSSGAVTPPVQDLGLRLEARKITAKYLIVDKVEKIPTGN